MILPIIDYANIFLSGCSQQELDNLQILQNHLLRCCFKIKDPREEHVWDLHRKANVKPIDIRRKIQLICSIRESLRKGHLSVIDTQRTTTAAGAPQIHLPIPRTAQFSNSHFYVGSLLWNSLPSHIMTDKGAFKAEITYRVINNII